MFDNEKAKLIINFYKAKENILPECSYLNKLYNELKIGFNNLKRCEDIDSRAAMEMMLKNETVTPGFLWQEKLVAEYKVFLTMIGVIDARYDSLEKEIDGEVMNQEYIQNLIEKKNILIGYRNKIIGDYMEIGTPAKLEILPIVLECVPSHQKFSELLEDMVKNHYQLSLQGEVITSYLNGYNISLRFYLEEAMAIYENLLSKYKKVLTKNIEYKKLVKTNKSRL
jgi:hypothetical protein